MDSSDLATQFRDIFRDMAAAWRAAPEPNDVPVAEATRSALAEASAVAVIYGWMARTVRTGEAALLLNDHGFATEAAPLVRTMIEHAIGMWWLVEERGTAFQVLVRAHSERMRRFKEAQETGWTLDGSDVQARLQEAIDIETDQATVTRYFMQHVKSQAAEYGQGGLYQAWLIESGNSHASLASARPYYEEEPTVDRGTIRLLSAPRDSDRDMAARVVAVIYAALMAYNRLLPDEPLSDQLAQWDEQLADLGARLAADNASSGRPS